jgi:hypothetical protein
MGERLGIEPVREGTTTRTSAGGPGASPSGSCRYQVVAGVLCTTTSPNYSTGTIRHSSRTSSESTFTGASSASAASLQRAAWITKGTPPWRTRSGSLSNLRLLGRTKGRKGLSSLLYSRVRRSVASPYGFGSGSPEIAAPALTPVVVATCAHGAHHKGQAFS